MEENTMTTYQVHPIGTIHNDQEEAFITLDPEYLPALQALDGFSHIEVLWWFSDFDTKEARSVLETEQPYKKAPAVLGIFATRSPIRPNPIALHAQHGPHRITNSSRLVQPLAQKPGGIL